MPMMRWILLLGWNLYWFCPAPVIAQPPADSFQLNRSLPLEARFATADNLGNIYLITTQNALEKYSPEGLPLGRYSTRRLGNASWLDVTNPLKLLVWYSDFRTVVFLDRNLTLLGELNLINAGFPEVRAVATAQDGNLWIYDESQFKLRKIGAGGEVLFESQALNIQLPERLQITCLRDNGTQLLASDPETGVLQFDAYGQFQKTLPWKGIRDFQLENNQLLYLGKDSLQTENLQVFQSRAWSLPETARQPAATAWLSPNCLFVQNGENLEVWTWLRR